LEVLEVLNLGLRSSEKVAKISIYTPRKGKKNSRGRGIQKQSIQRVGVQTKKTFCVEYGYFLEQHNAIYMYTSTICQ